MESKLSRFTDAVRTLYRGRYVLHLEAEITRLRGELEAEKAERRAAVDSMLQHVGAPPMNTPRREHLGQIKRGPVPSKWRRDMERADRNLADEARKAAEQVQPQ